MGFWRGYPDIRSVEDYALGIGRIEGPRTTVLDTCFTAFWHMGLRYWRCYRILQLLHNYPHGLG